MAQRAAGPGRARRQPDPAARPQQPVDGDLLAGDPADRRRRRRHHAAAAGERDLDDRRDRAGRPGPVRRPVHRRPAAAELRGAPRRHVHASWTRRRRAQSGEPLPSARHRRRRRRAAGVHLRHHRPAQGDDAPAPRRAGHRRHRRQARVPARPRRRRHRHATARVHVRARRAAGLPDARGRGDAAAGARHPGGAGRRDRAARRHRAASPRRRRTGRCWPRAPADRLRGLRRAVSAGEHLPRSTWQAFHDAAGVRIIDGIGSTEMLHVFISAADDDIRPGATGRAVPGYRATILDDDGEPVPDGTPGRLAVQGPDRLPLPRRRAAARLRPARLEHHRRHLRRATPTATSPTSPAATT